MAQPPPPSRTGSVGPGPGGMNVPPASTPGGQAPGSQQNLNQIVLEYLSKKGYSRTEAILRKESSNVDAQGQPRQWKFEDYGGKKYEKAFTLIKEWIDKNLDIYKPELKRLLWPLFVYSFLDAISDFFVEDAREFFNRFRELFDKEHEDDIRALSNISDTAHVQQNEVAKVYQSDRYRLSLSRMAHEALIEFLEVKELEGGKVTVALIGAHIDLRRVARTSAGGKGGLQRLMDEQRGEQDVPDEDEGIPGHHPGSANLDRANASTALNKLSLGPMIPEADLMEDVKADLSHEDSIHPPAPGQSSLLEQYEQNIKVEPTDEPPQSIPFPPSTARDVAMEVQKVKENRDRFRIIEGRTGGVGPGVSVTMFTFHNTFDSVNCIEFSGDNSLVAIGTAESYIRIWSLDNQALTSPVDPPGFQPSSSRRLVGHSGPVYALSFSPSAAVPEPLTNGHTATSTSSESHPRYMLSCSADTTIRLWSLDTWTNLVVYRSHNSPVWDVRFCPHGHYFASASADRTARLWSTSQIAPLRLFVGHDSDVETVAWHPNGAYVFTGAGVADRTVRAWDLVRGSCVRIFTGHIGNVTAIACAPNGHVIASADDKGEIILWDLPSGRLVKRMRGHERSGIWSLDWSVESSVLVSGAADGTVKVWDVLPPTESQGKTAGDGSAAGTKIDGATVGANSVVSKTGKGRSGKTQTTPDLISSFQTKESPVYKVRFTQMNLVMAGGAYLPKAGR